MNTYANICGFEFPKLDYGETIQLFEKWIEQGQSRQVCITNVHSIVTALFNKGFQKILHHSDLLTMDGQPLRWYANLIYGLRVKDRITGAELLAKTIAHGLERQWRHFFLGSTQEVLCKLQRRLEEKYPGLKVVGAHAPPFRPLTRDEDDALVTEINDSMPDFLWVGLGAPKQEKWIFDHLDRVHVPVQAGVGAAFDFHSGNIKRAPLSLQKAGLEWLYRIYRDPRLWKRYLSTNPVFLGLFIRDYIKVRLVKNPSPSSGPASGS
jgi:N-acetylglucosaminyldiphosphoundecaprenol N-acetyl-beta-D-mannosaminyltransferase